MLGAPNEGSAGVSQEEKLDKGALDAPYESEGRDALSGFNDTRREPQLVRLACDQEEGHTRAQT